MNDNDEIVCKNTYASDDTVELPVYGQIEEAFYLHIKHVDHQSHEEEEDYEDGDLRYTSSETEEGKFSINLLKENTVKNFRKS